MDIVKGRKGKIGAVRVVVSEIEVVQHGWRKDEVPASAAKMSREVLQPATRIFRIGKSWRCAAGAEIFARRIRYKKILPGRRTGINPDRVGGVAKAWQPRRDRTDQ